RDSRWTEDGLSQSIQGEYGILNEIVELALRQGSSLNYPFQGSTIGPFRILSPSAEAYMYLLPQFDKTPEANRELIEQAGFWLPSRPLPIINTIANLFIGLKNLIPENWQVETLRDGGITSASNESSVILYGDFGNGQKVLLTGDAGIRALTWAADYADGLYLPLQ